MTTVLSRRLFAAAGAGGVLTFPFAASRLPGGRPRPRLLKSRLPLPRPYSQPLKIPAVAAPDTELTLTQREAQIELLPGVRTSIWGYDGQFPGPTIEAQRGRPLTLRVINQLPVPTVTHLHGGITPPESDGYPTDLLLPRGYRTEHGHMRDPLAVTAQGERSYLFPNRQRAAALWYHDHRMDFTGPQVYRGLAGLYILRDPEETALGFPSGDREIPLLLCDRSFDSDGALLYPSADPNLRIPGVAADYMGGVLGDVSLVNGTPWPWVEVASVRYRLRILNASNARRYRLRMLSAARKPVPFIQIGSDGGLLDAPVRHDSLWVAPAERFDMVVDFGGHEPGETIELMNDEGSDGTARVMEFRVVRQMKDDSRAPVALTLRNPREPIAISARRAFDFAMGTSGHWLINGREFDPSRCDAEPRLDTYEVWRMTTDFHHPVHAHGVHFKVLSHSGRPLPSDAGWKDTVDLGPGGGAELLVRFGGFRGRYVYHCHNLEHEDMAMMGNFRVV